MSRELPLTLEGTGEPLAAILHPGVAGEDSVSLGILIVVGGHQYRVGSHRQFVQLARSLAGAGVPVLRLDYTGMGDSAGEKKGFDDLDQDIRRGIDALMEQLPGLRGVVLWGLCDGASASLMYAPKDPRVMGLVMVNPWLENPQARAATLVWNYYLKRFFSASLWKKCFAGGVNLKRSGGVLACSLMKAQKSEPSPAGAYQSRMLEAYQGFDRPVLWILSGNDLTAAEFWRTYRVGSWRRATRKKRCVGVRWLAAADHTFSCRAWKSWLEKETLTFMRSLNKQR